MVPLQAQVDTAHVDVQPWQRLRSLLNKPPWQLLEQLWLLEQLDTTTGALQLLVQPWLRWKRP